MDRDAELSNRSEHILYEARMLIGLADELASHRLANLVQGEMPVVKNACLESFGIHARVILNFLYDRKEKDDGIIAADYFDDPLTWKRARPKRSQLLEKVHSRVSCEIAHLTDLRQRIDKDWPFAAIAHEIDSIFRHFLALAPAGRISQPHAQHYRSARNTLARQPPQSPGSTVSLCAKTSW
jgi:hypothetical protein